jgi:nicotinamide-nucleotide amidase
MFSDTLRARAENLLAAARAQGLKIATAESCTGGLVAGLLTEIAGSSDVVERGFVTYSNQAKEEMLGVPGALIHQHGAVSKQVALAMAEGALRNSLAHVAVAVTGIAGPGGGTAEKPVGLVYIATHMRPDVTTPLEFTGTTVAECQFGDIGRSEVRLKTVETALGMLEPLVK